MKRSGCQNQNNPAVVQNLGQWLSNALQALRSLPDEPTSSIYALIANTLEKPGYWPQAHPEFELNTGQIEELDLKLKRLLAGEPLPYITGKQAFYGLDFFVNSDVLIPRPETELLVEAALDWLGENSNRNLIADIGTGSACIAVSIANYNPDHHTIATDISLKSLQVAKQNITVHKLEQHISLVQTDLLNGIQTQFDLICANLPYIPSYKLDTLNAAKYEPPSALDGGSDGLNLISRLLEQAKNSIKSGGLILLEMEYSQADPIKRLVQTHFPGASVTITNDLNNLPRLVKIEL